MSKTGDWVIETLNGDPNLTTGVITSHWLRDQGFYESTTHEMGFSGTEYSKGLLFLTTLPHGWVFSIGLTDEWHLVGGCELMSNQTIEHIKALCYGMGIKLNGDAK